MLPIAAATAIVTACGDQHASLASSDKSPEPSASPSGESAPKEPPSSFRAAPTPVRQMGLIAREDVDPYLSKEMFVNNAYGGNDQGTYYLAIAGAPSQAARIGQLLLVTADADTDTAPNRQRRYTPPGIPHGSLTITTGALPILSLRAADGTQYTFDVRTGDFTLIGPP